MIDLKYYNVQIGEADLYNLLFSKRFDLPNDGSPDPAKLQNALDNAESEAKSLIEERFWLYANR